MGENIYKKNLSTVFEDSSHTEIANKVSNAYKFELERIFNNYQFQIITLIGTRGCLSDLITQSYAPGTEEEPMMIVETDDSTIYTYDAISCVLAFKRRREELNSNIDLKEGRIDTEVNNAIQQVVETKRNLKDKTENLTIVNKILLEAEERVKLLIQKIKFAFFIVLTTPNITYEIGYSNLYPANTTRIETRLTSNEFKVLVVTLLYPNV